MKKSGFGNGLSRIRNTFTERFQLQMPVVYHSMYISKNDLSRHIPVKREDKVADVSGSTQNIGISGKAKLRLTKLKDMHIKSIEKIIKEECYSVDFTQQFQNFGKVWVEDDTSDTELLFPIVNSFRLLVSRKCFTESTVLHYI